MHTAYSDILERIADQPIWWDENAVPRFVPFEPHRMANIYAVEAALVRVRCQGCSREFDVAVSQPSQNYRLPGEVFEGPPVLIRHQIRSRLLHYGDPPNVGCCAAGASMNSVPQRVLEYWVKPYALGDGISSIEHDNGRVSRTIRALDVREWRREEALEVNIEPPWAKR